VRVALKSTGNHQPLPLLRPQPPHLPVTVSLQRLKVQGLQIAAPRPAPPINVDHVTLAAQLDNRSWSVSGLQMSGAHVQVSGQGDWQFRHAEHIGAQLQWQLDLPQWPAFAGQAAVEGDAHRLRLKASLSAPFPLQLAAGIRELFTAPSWNGTLEFGGLDPQRLRGGWPELVADGALRLQGDPRATLLSGDINAREPTYGLWQSHVNLGWTGQVLKIRSLELARAKTATRFALAGQVPLCER